jgi:DNA-binding transcriptional LysR family regulator
VELRQLVIFEAVVREGTVGAAAIALGRAPSSVSEQLRSLERSLGVTLFERRSRGMNLTPAGERLQGWARSLLEQSDAARRDVAAAPVELRLGALETVMAIHVPRMLARLAARRPGIQVKTAPAIGRVALLDDVVGGSIDAALLLDRGGALGGLGFDTPPGDFAHLDVETVPLSLVVAASHPLAERGTPELDDVEDYPLVGNSPACSFWLAADRLFSRRMRRIEAGSVAIAKAWTVQGEGVSLLPDFAIATELAARQVVRLPVETPPLDLRMVWRSDREERPGVRDLLYAIADPSR